METRARRRGEPGLLRCVDSLRGMAVCVSLFRSRLDLLLPAVASAAALPSTLALASPLVPARPTRLARPPAPPATYPRPHTTRTRLGWATNRQQPARRLRLRRRQTTRPLRRTLVVCLATTRSSIDSRGTEPSDDTWASPQVAADDPRLSAATHKINEVDETNRNQRLSNKNSQPPCRPYHHHPPPPTSLTKVRL